MAQTEGNVCITLNQVTTEAGDLRGTVADHAVKRLKAKLKGVSEC